MANIVKNITKLSGLPELKKAVGKTIVAYNKDNYAIDISLIKGKKIQNIREVKSNNENIPNYWIIEFSDGTSTNLMVYNGHNGPDGERGYKGEKGPQGETVPVDFSKIVGANEKYTIVNESVIVDVPVDAYGNFINEDGQVIDAEGNIVDIIDDHDPNVPIGLSCTEGVWSALRGKLTNEGIESLSETFITEEEYDELFNPEYVQYIDAQFTTTSADESVQLFNDDTNKHIKYQKFWTYEDSDVSTYYIYNPVSDTYDPVVVSLWDDIYLGESSGYFFATTNQIKDQTQIYYFDEFDGEYKPIEKVEIKDSNENFLANDYFDIDYYDKDLEKYIKIHYVYSTSKYSYELKTEHPLEKPVWEYDKLVAEYTKVLETPISYYKKVENEYELIEDIAAFITENSTAELYVLNGQQYEVFDTSETYYSKNGDSYEEITDIKNYISTNVNYALYTKKDVMTYKKVADNSTIDVDAYGGVYFEQVGDEFIRIQNIAAYLAVSAERWYVVDSNGVVYEVESEEDVDKDNHQEYLKVTVNSLAGTTTFHRWYPYTKYGETSYLEVEKVYGKNGINLYVNDEDRTYYTSEYVTTTNAAGETEISVVYIPVEIPYWIYATFVTTEEDEETLLLNAAGQPGNSEAEDNSEIDTTAEDYIEEETDIIPVEFMAAGPQPHIYYLEEDSNTYVEVPIEFAINHNTIYYSNDHLVINDDYVYDTGEVEYKEIDKEAIYPGLTVYKKVDDVYRIANPNTETDPDIIYYVEKPKYAEVTPSTFSEYYLTLITGEPKQLPIWFYPLNANNKKAKVEFDDTKIAFYEGGRIASIEEFEDYEGYKETDIYITPETGQGLHIHVKLVKPVSSINVTKSEGYGFTNAKVYDDIPTIVIGESTDLKALVGPAKASDKTLVYNSSISGIEFGEQHKDTDENDNEIPYVIAASVKGQEQGTANISITAADGYGATASTMIDIVDPVESSEFDIKDAATAEPNDIIHVDTIYFKNEQEVAKYNRDHGYEVDDDGYIVWDVANPPVKEAEHLEMQILKGIAFEMPINNTPSDSSKTDFTWEVTPNIANIEKRTVEEIIIPEHTATEEDVNNNLADNIGDVIPAVTESRETYMITGNVVGTCYVTGKNRFNAAYYDDDDEHITNTELELKVVIIQSVENISIVSPPISFNVGTKKQFTAKIEPDNANVKTYKWSSSDPSVATIDENGIVTGVSAGSTIIKVEALDGSGKYDTCSVSISEPITDIQFTNGIIYVGEGATSEVTAELAFNDSIGVENAQVEWLSANPDIATVNGYNNVATVSGIKTGSTIIIARDKNNSGAMGTLQVNVITLVESIAFSPACSDLIVDVNDMVVMDVVFTPEDSTIQVLEYASSDPSIAKVSNEGIVTALKEGTVTITATTTDGGTASPATTTIEVTK